MEYIEVEKYFSNLGLISNLTQKNSCLFILP